VTAAADVARRLLARPPTLGSGRLVCVDGPAGAGKTTLAADLLEHLPGLSVALLHMDDVYDGWAGLDAGIGTVATSVVEPLRSGRPGRYRRYDWHAGRFAEEHVVPPADVLVVEGVGSGAAAYQDAVTCLVWVDAPADVRLERAVARDGEQLREHWDAWRALEETVFVRERTRQRADLVVEAVASPPTD
jgi:uridine kinase